jgi:PAS domain S-box-containing protein
MDYQQNTQQFKESLREFGNFEELFEHLDDIYFFAKDRNYKLMMCNQANVRLLGLREKAEVIGKSEYDFFPKNFADSIHEDDVNVMEQGVSIINRVELILDEGGATVWVSTNKMPLYRKGSQVAGLMGTTRVIGPADRLPDPYRKYAKTLDYMKDHFDQTISVEQLARMNSISTAQFRVNFKRLFRVSPQQFILKLRMQAACRALTEGHDEIAEIALDCGFCDQSYFTRQFRIYAGMTPKQYRTLYFRK